MSLSCPHCGAEIVGLIPGSAPLPGWRNPPQNLPQTTADPTANGAVAGKVLDLEPSSPSAKSRSTSKAKYQYLPAFEEFWKVYPLHLGKADAYRRWQQAIQYLTATATADSTATANAILIAGAIRYRDDPNRDPGHTKWAEGWLNGHRWEDDPLPARLDSRRPPDPPRPMTSGEMDRAIEEALRD